VTEFSVADTSGIEHRICAKRITSEGRYLWFHDVTVEGWTAVGRIDRARVSRVSRSITRGDGGTHWVPQPIPSESECMAED
jgi:hypothetical protein